MQAYNDISWSFAYKQAIDPPLAPPASSMNSGLSIQFWAATFFRQQVQISTLDKVMSGREGRFVIKMDVEGAEVEALRGAEKTLQGDHLWLIEVTGEAAFSNHSSDNRATVSEMMTGYSLERVGHNVLYQRTSAI